MKKIGKIFVFAALAMASYSASAELAPQWQKGTMLANVELGLEPVGTAVSVDYVLVDSWWQGHFTVGGEIDYGHNSYSYWNENRIGVTPRVTYGLNITPQFEVHAMFGMGFAYQKDKYDAVSHGSYFGVEVTSEAYSTTSTYLFSNDFVGCRYFFSDNVSVMGEVGYSNGFPDIRAGLSFKF